MWNPLRAKDKMDGLTNFSSEIVNYNDEINNFKIEGDSPSFIKEQFRIQHFVHSYLEKQKKVYLFESLHT